MKPQDLAFDRYRVDLTSREVRHRRVRCADLEDALGGIARGMRLLEDCAVGDAFDPRATLVMNLGALTGTQFMTGLRTFFHAWSPLKGPRDGRPSPMWSAGSCKFGVKLRGLGVDEVVVTGRAPRPTLLRIVPSERKGGAPARFLFEDAAGLAGRRVNDKVQALHGRFPGAHFAVLGPAGENWRAVRYGAVALSTENQLASGDPKPRFCGRGGMGSVLGSKNVLAIAADGPDPPAPPQPSGLKELNREVARGKGSARFRDKRYGGGGGTWGNCGPLGAVHALPEFNFAPRGTDDSARLWRENVEAAGSWVVKDESCWRCGIRCHKNLYDRTAGGAAGAFRAKFDYEPLVLLGPNLGHFDPADVMDLVVLVDDLGLDAISLGTTLSYAMEFNRRHAADGRQVLGGFAFGDAAAARRTIVEVGEGRLPLVGQGVRRLSEALGETAYAMQCKGMELPAYLPQTNPGYPFALAGGHMSMRTYFLYLFERETGLDYWVDAITRRGPAILRDDVLGVCKFAGMGDEDMAEAVRTVTGLDVTEEDLRRVVLRTYLRGYRLERRHGFAPVDYALPAETYCPCPGIGLPPFVTEEFFHELRHRVLARFDAMAAAEGLAVEGS